MFIQLMVASSMVGVAGVMVDKIALYCMAEKKHYNDFKSVQATGLFGPSTLL